MLSNSVCNHTHDEQIGHPLRSHSILLITRMITDRIGLHSVLLPLLNGTEYDIVLHNLEKVLKRSLILYLNISYYNYDEQICLQ